MSAPFIVYALPRSRTHWLSYFLSYGDYHCRHEAAQHLRTLEDAKSLLSMDYSGCAETGASPAWRIVQHYRPDIKVLVVRRPIEEVIDSLMRLNLSGIAQYDIDIVEKGMRKLNRYLDQIEAEGTNVLSVTFAELATEDGCRKAFEHCLPYPFDPSWWKIFAPMNLQVNHRALIRYRLAHRAQIDRMKAEGWAELRRLRKAGIIERAH